MKRILITGANSYIGTSFEKWMAQYKGYEIDTIDMKDGSWREKDFSGYDVVFHVAGIAHADVGKISKDTKELYYKVNRDLAIETCEKYKNDILKGNNNGQFIFMSSIIVYGNQSYITKDTKPKPKNFYGDSKWQADKGVRNIAKETRQEILKKGKKVQFNVAVIRSPMIYGKNSKGNYSILAKIATHFPVFPDWDNERSMLHIDNLCEFVRLLIERQYGGVFFPQNSSYVKTSDMVRLIATYHNKKMFVTKLLSPFIMLAIKLPDKISRQVKKAFGSSIYEMKLSYYGIDSKYFLGNYQIRNLEESIELSENRSTNCGC